MAAPVRGMAGSPSIGNTTSFQKKTRSKLVSIPGTRPSVQNGQLLVSSGVSSLDYVIGGGLAVGTLLLVEEDCYDSYSRMLLKYFLAEGVVCGHELFLASARDHPDEIMQELPSPIVDDVAGMKISEGQSQPSDPENPDTMKIAWRYQNQPRVQVKDHLLGSIISHFWLVQLEILK
uniref:Elongator complex protein 4 n=1 Tax=Cyprinus carpio TaxID=7962 RepID=A0A8C2DNU0_CYPCA